MHHETQKKMRSLRKPQNIFTRFTYIYFLAALDQHNIRIWTSEDVCVKSLTNFLLFGQIKKKKNASISKTLRSPTEALSVLAHNNIDKQNVIKTAHKLRIRIQRVHRFYSYRLPCIKSSR